MSDSPTSDGVSERGSADRPALARLVSLDTTAFASEHWGSRPLLSRASALPGDFADLFSADAVDELVAHRGIRTPFARMAKEGSVLSPSRYTASGGFGAEIGDQLSSERVLAEFADGASLVLQGLHRTWRPLTDFTRELVGDLGHRCQVNAYITPESSRGFDPHYDVHDVFVIQISGTKHWTIHEPAHVDPLASQPWSSRRADVEARAAGEPAIDAVLEPGDVLYLPRGWIHSATALGGTSVHLTIGVSAYTRDDILESIIERARDDVRLRASLPLGIDLTDPDALRPLVDEIVSDLADALATAATSPELADAASASLTRRFAGAVRAEPLAPLATIEALGALGPDTVVSWRRGATASTRRDGEVITIRWGDSTVSLPVEAADAVEALATGADHTVGSLPGLDEASALVVVRRLVREGILVVR
ncbi:cupin domain-containing protein [Marisediminicola sp. LYQ85]|uniref:cupin domain-containing protein n=1 Tax=Marisediminicola sp. LYQ85 TaxID=3391062 RepID=UPI003982DCEB